MIGPARWGWDEYTYYPGLGMIAVGRRLLPALKWYRGQGVHYWEAMTVGRWEDYGVVNRSLELRDSGGYTIFVSYMWPGSERVNECMYTGLRAHCTRHLYVLIVPQLWRIQRAVRAFLVRRRWMREARLVFALGLLDPRCGHAALPAETVARVCAYVQ